MAEPFLPIPFCRFFVKSGLVLMYLEGFDSLLLFLLEKLVGHGFKSIGIKNEKKKQKKVSKNSLCINFCQLFIETCACNFESCAGFFVERRFLSCVFDVFSVFILTFELFYFLSVVLKKNAENGK